MVEPQTFEHDGRLYVVLESAEQADEFVDDDLLEECLAWFEDERGIPAEPFIDKLSDVYGVAPYDRSAPGFEIQDYDSQAARRLLSRARRLKREAQG